MHKNVFSSIFHLLALLQRLPGLDYVAVVLAVAAVPVLALVTDPDGVRVVLLPELEAAALLAFLPLDVLADLALGGVLPRNGGIHLHLQLLGPVGHLDGDLQPRGLVSEEEFEVRDLSELHPDVERA